MTISHSELLDRRKTLMRAIGKKGVALIASASPCFRNMDVEYPYRQNSDFYYLTGFDEPESVAVFIPHRQKGEFILFCRERDPEKAVWTGSYMGLENVRCTLGADESFSITELEQRLPGLLENRDRIYFAVGEEDRLNRAVFKAVHTIQRQSRSGAHAPYEFVALSHVLHEQRLHKSDNEITLLRKAIEIAVLAHKRAMRASYPGRYEYEIEAELEYEFALHGCRSAAYPCIVASGENACTLHYTDHRSRLKDGDLLLIDAGAEYQYYAADITRTFPINGHFTEPQRLIYELVLRAQEAAFSEIRPGRTWAAPHAAAVKVLTQGLIQLGLLSGTLSTLLRNEAYKKFYMHRTGHWLGMDVHDVGTYRIKNRWRIFRPGMVLTVEPGLYIRSDCEEVAPHWRGIGIRIEDDVLVTPNGHEILTAALPKSVVDIETYIMESRCTMTTTS